MTPKPKRRAKKKVDTRSTTPPTPPIFGVAHDFSVLHPQPYVVGDEVVFYNLILDRELWCALFGHTHNGSLDEARITNWIRLLMERWFQADQYTIKPPNFFVWHLLEDSNDWRAFMSGVATYANIIVPWWDVDMEEHPRRPLNMAFTLEDNVPQQSSGLGDCVVFACMFMEQLVSGQQIRELIDPKNVALEFRQRMTKIYWGSCVGPM
uniref:Ubiquitin-like protease family profile domain-containing protein n=1 Tax=Lactuca sativa TaxID=4236 RepID=A0A9R1XTN5_LACSA|nr:hypothetical protein LSAT_V11C100026640 [Lactuca sativa]